MEVSGRFIEKETLLLLNFVWPHSLKFDIGQGFDDSYLGLGITHSQTFLKYNFCAHYFVIILYALSLFSSCIAKGLAMCRLGGGV